MFRRAAFVALGLQLVVGLAKAKPVIHEYIDLPPGNAPLEPIVIRAAGVEEQAPPQLSAAHSPTNPSLSTTAPQGALADPDSVRSALPDRFAIDRDTRRPESASYSDPFTPSIVPFKRLIVYDAVDESGRLHVGNQRLGPVSRQAVRGAREEHFHAKLQLELQAGVAEPIPSVAPSSRVVSVYSSPPVALELLKDSADNWYARSEADVSLSLSLQVAADRRVFGSAWSPNARFAALASRLPSVPPGVQSRARAVAATLGIARDTGPAHVVERLVRHFRGFRASNRSPRGSGLDLYSEIALTGRGICRHRAYAFTVTALGLGIPARYAMNEAHAWVEVFDGQLWHRIDLGGSAGRLEQSGPERPRHVEPTDPYPWPPEQGPSFSNQEATGPANSSTTDGTSAQSRVPTSDTNGERSAGFSESGSSAGSEQAELDGAGSESIGLSEPDTMDSAEASPAEGEPATGEPGSVEHTDDPQREAPPGADSLGEPQGQEARGPLQSTDAQQREGLAGSPERTRLPPSAASEPAPVPPLVIRQLRASARGGQRGQAIRVQGQVVVQGSGKPCRGVRVAVGLQGLEGSHSIGTLLADHRGRFAGELVVPWALPVGDYELLATPSDAACPIVSPR